MLYIDNPRGLLQFAQRLIAAMDPLPGTGRGWRPPQRVLPGAFGLNAVPHRQLRVHLVLQLRRRAAPAACTQRP